MHKLTFFAGSRSIRAVSSNLGRRCMSVIPVKYEQFSNVPGESSPQKPPRELHLLLIADSISSYT
jgi:hypothetical protein